MEKEIVASKEKLVKLFKRELEKVDSLHLHVSSIYFRYKGNQFLLRAEVTHERGKGTIQLCVLFEKETESLHTFDLSREEVRELSLMAADKSRTFRDDILGELLAV